MLVLVEPTDAVHWLATLVVVSRFVFEAHAAYALGVEDEFVGAVRGGDEDELSWFNVGLERSHVSTFGEQRECGFDDDGVVGGMGQHAYGVE